MIQEIEPTDWCDRDDNRARAAIVVSIDVAGERMDLAFCGHHWNASKEKLLQNPTIKVLHSSLPEHVETAAPAGV